MFAAFPAGWAEPLGEHSSLQLVPRRRPGMSFDRHCVLVVRGKVGSGDVNAACRIRQSSNERTIASVRRVLRAERANGSGAMQQDLMQVNKSLLPKASRLEAILRRADSFDRVLTCVLAGRVASRVPAVKSSGL
jgi:hypothetical protein